MGEIPTMPALEYGPNEVDFIELGDNAAGSIGQTPETRPRLREFTNRVGGGEFHIETDIILPCGCIDGRVGCWPRPDAAGGTLSLAVADDLLEQKYARDCTTSDMVTNVFKQLCDHGFVVGGHTDEHAEGDASGCGANDKLEVIYGIISLKSEAIREISGTFGIEVDDDTHRDIVLGATRRGDFSTGSEVLGSMRAHSDPENIDVLRGDHKEVVAIVNRRQGTTLDRDAVRAEFGDDYEAFNIDAWSFEAGARALYPDADDITIQRAVAAMVYYNIATALALCGPNMRVVVLE